MSDRLSRWLGIGLLASLILWGLYGAIYYLHVPVHQAVLLSDVQRIAIGDSCAADAVFCRGLSAIVPMIGQFFTWAQPLGSYVAVCLVLFLIGIGGMVLWRGTARVTWSMSPLKIYSLFLASLWLIFTCLSFGTDGDQPFRRYFEPTQQIFDVGPQALEALQEDFRDLDARGCLSPDGVTRYGSGQYILSGTCIQLSFISRVLTQLLFVTLLVFAFLSVGKTLLGLLRVRSKTLLMEAVFSFGLGACMYVVILWTLAVAGFLTTTAGWVSMITPVILCYPSLLYWLRQSKDARWSMEMTMWDLRPIIVWLLISYLALNFLNVVRPFPIGWDDLGSYLNRPRLLVSYGEFIATMSPFQWEYLTSLGFLLFGYDSTFGTTASMMVNWSSGLLSVGVVLAFVRAFLGRGGLIAALLYYVLPLVGHFSFADMKVDNAVFAMGSLSLLAAFLALFPSADQDPDPDPVLAPRQDLTWMMLAGIFAGFAFAMKSTAVMVIFALLGVTIGVTLHASAFVATMIFAWGIFANKGIFTLSDVVSRILGRPLGGEQNSFDFLLSNQVFSGILFVLSAAIFAWSFWKYHSRLNLTLQRLGVFIAAAGIAVAPWILHNNLMRGNIIPHFELSAANMKQPAFDFTGLEQPSSVPPVKRVIPADLAVDMKNPICRATGAKEELDRYWGYGQGWSHYLTLPWRTVMNINGAGYYVTTMAALLLFPLLLLLPMFWSRDGRWLRWLAAGTAFIVVEWMFLANGIPWYGIGMFLGLCIALEMLITWAPTRSTKIAAGVLVAFSVLTCLSMRMWQFNGQQALFAYPLGKVSSEAMRERTIPFYDDVRMLIEARRQQVPDRPYVYRVGTFIPYFIPKNPEVIALTDNQLDTFNCIYQERDAALTIRRLQAMGFGSIIFDTNTATIEQNPQGTLHQKVNEFINFLNRSDLGMKVLINSPENGIVYVLLP